jgi:hypothetical protein
MCFFAGRIIISKTKSFPELITYIQCLIPYFFCAVIRIVIVLTEWKYWSQGHLWPLFLYFHVDSVDMSLYLWSREISQTLRRISFFNFKNYYILAIISGFWPFLDFDLTLLKLTSFALLSCMLSQSKTWSQSYDF